MRNTDRTLLFSSNATVSSCDLSEPLSAFERFEVVFGDNQSWESQASSDCSLRRLNRFGSYNNDGYIQWPANYVVSNGTNKIECNHFQLLMQQGTNTGSRTFGFNNTASNVKNMKEVWGINRITQTQTTGIGSPGEDFKEYNETLLWSGTDAPETVTLTGRGIDYERIKVMVGTHGESINLYEVDTPTTYTSWMPLYSYWGTSTGSYYLSMHRYQWQNETKEIKAISGKTHQLGTASANPYTATGDYTSTSRYVRRPLLGIWGINEKSKHNLTLLTNEYSGNIASNRLSGVEFDVANLSTTSNAGAYLSGIAVTGGTLTQKTLTFGNNELTAEALWNDTPWNLTLQNDGHGTLTATTTTGEYCTTSTLTPTPATHYAFSAYSTTGGWRNGNTYTFGNSNGTAKAWFSAIHYNITTANDGHGTCTCNKTTATGNETATLGNSPATYYAFNNYQVTGGSVNGSTLTVTSNCTAKATFTAKNFTITLQTDGHGKLTCNKTTVTGGSTATLTPSYSSYYRFNNYSITGGSVNGNTLTVTANCTAKANFKANIFTAKGNFETGTGTCVSPNSLNFYKYAKRTASTNAPTSWYATSSRWNPSNANSYRISGYIHMSGRGTDKGTISMATRIGNSYINTATVTGKTTYQQGINYSKTFNSTTQGNVLGSARIYNTTSFGGYKYSAYMITGTWTASGYAP